MTDGKASKWLQRGSKRHKRKTAVAIKSEKEILIRDLLVIADMEKEAVKQQLNAKGHLGRV